MRKIGMLGGMSWESSSEYYRLINEIVKADLGDTHSANCLMYSFDFYEIEKLQHKGEWEALTNLLVSEAVNLKNAGAQCIVICTNTMHLMAKAIEEGTQLPVIHIADATADEIINRQVKKVLLLGTEFTMSGDFYRERIEVKGIELVIPSDEDRKLVHDTIYKELILGEIKADSKEKFVGIINKMKEKGVEGVILGCTEIPLLIQDGDVEMEVFDTTAIHAKAAAMFSMAESECNK